MIVMKFGGTSLGSPERIRDACGLIKRATESESANGAGVAVLVVVSAHSRVTDMLISAGRTALEGDAETGLSALRARHHEILEGLGMDATLVDKNLGEVGELLNGIRMLRELSTRTMDIVQSFGERMSSKVVAAALRDAEVNAEAVNAYDLGLTTDDRHGEARPLADTPERIALALEAHTGKVIVTTGFVAKAPNGDITTLGRGGSDYTAAIFGAAAGAREIQIWTDVDGVMTADPSIIKDAKSLEAMSFAEASEVAYFGGRVLHPSTMIPAVEKNIPIRVLNTFKPESPGTVILVEAPGESGQIRSIVYKENITLIDVTSNRMLLQSGFMAKLFEVFSRHDIVIDMIATSEVTVSLTTDNPANIDAAAREIEEEGYARVRVSDGKAIVCVVGQGMREQAGTAAKIFEAISAANVNVQMISQGASEINIALLIDNDDILPAVRGLHDLFFADA